ncbi:hypothetical protein GEMRC1_005871 [Eukaryota sp. GEM-RC1]
MSQSVATVSVDPKKASTQIFDKSDINQILKFGARELFTEDEVQATTKVEERLKFNDDEIDRILNLQEDSFDGQDQQVSDAQQFLNKFEFADYSSKPEVEDVGIADANFWKNLISQEIEAPVLESQVLGRSRSRGPRVVEDFEDDVMLKEDVYFEGSDLEFDDPTAASGKLVGGKIAQKDMKHVFRAFRALPSYSRIADITRLSGIPKSEAVILKVCEELLQYCEDAVARSNKDYSEKGSLYVEWRGVKSINAADLLRKVREFETIRIFLSSFLDMEFLLNADLSTPEATELIKTKIPEETLGFSAPSWCKTWDFVDDMKLLVSTYRIGFGNWERFRKEPDLGIGLKIGDTKTPMLSRRVEYLLRRINGFLSPEVTSPREKPKATPRKTRKKVDNHVPAKRTRKPDGLEVEKPSTSSSPDLYSEGWCKLELTDARDFLQRLALKSSMGEQLNMGLLTSVGNVIEDVISSDKYASFTEETRTQMRNRLWEYVSNFCNTDYVELKELYYQD